MTKHDAGIDIKAKFRPEPRDSLDAQLDAALGGLSEAIQSAESGQRDGYWTFSGRGQGLGERVTEAIE